MAQAHNHRHNHSRQSGPDEGPVLTTTEARQGKNYGVWKILAVSLTLAVAAGAAFMAAGFKI